jgi:hypothetical protein
MTLVVERPAAGPPRPWSFPSFDRLDVAGGRVLAAHLPGGPLAVVQLVADAGAVTEPAGQEGVAELVVQALSEGAGDRDAYAFAVAGERLGASWAASAGWDALRCGFEVPVSELAAATDLLADAVRRPRLDSPTLSRLRDERLDEIRIEHSQPVSRAMTAFAAASIVGIAVIIDRMCQPEDRTVALALWLTSPMVLLHLLGGVHLDDLMALLVALACLSAQHRRWVLAAVAIGVCTAVKVPAAAALPAVVLVDLPSAHGPAVRSVVVRSLGAAAGYLVPAAAVGDPSGLLRTVTSPTGNHTLAAPSVLVGKLLGGSHLANAATATVGVLAAIALILWLVRTADRRPAPVTIGGSLLAIVIGAPVVYPWYLAWGLPGLVIRPRRWLPTLITAGSLIYLPGLSGLSALAVVLVVVVAAALVAASWRIGETLAH